MMNDFAFAADRIRTEALSPRDDCSAAILAAQYMCEAIATGQFSGVKFTEFRAIFADAQLPHSGGWKQGCILHAVEWLSEHSDKIGINFPKKLPKVAPPVATVLANSVMAPHLNAIADLLGGPQSATEGPVSQGLFVYRGKTADCIPPAPWRLLEFMNDKREADMTLAYRYAICDAVKDPTESAIGSMLSKANKALEAVVHPERLSKPRNVSKIVWG